MKKQIISLSVMLISFWFSNLISEANAQSNIYECSTPDPIQLPFYQGSWAASCGTIENYIPTPSSPTLVYRLNYHFFNDPNNPSAPFNFTADWTLIQQHISWMNAILANLISPTLPTNPPAPLIPNAKIQFVLDASDVFYHTDPQFWPNQMNECQSYGKNNYGVDVNRELNVFWYWHQTLNRGCGPYGSHVNMMSNDISNPQNYFSWTSAQLLVHELGHALGYLLHTMTSAQFNDITPDTQWGWIPCNNTTVSNNIMGYNMCRDYLSPKQIGNWHSFAYNGASTKFLTTCNYNANNTIILNSDETWSTSKIIGGDLIIEPGNTLIVQCAVWMPMNGKVIVKPNARLIIDGGVISNVCGEYWDGIEVWGNRNENQFPAVHPLHQGKVEIKNNGSIEHAINAVRLWNPGDYNSSGGVLVCNNAAFRQNKRAVEFISYHNTHPTNGTPYRNLSGFYNVEFALDDILYRINSPFNAHVTMWDVE